MPTGYTEIIEREGGCTFEEYVWRCARAFGALFLMRDEPWTAPIPERFQADGWHREQLLKARKRLVELREMPEAEATHQANERYEKALEAHEKSVAHRRGIAERYAAIRAQVEAWLPPTSNHEGMKKFMLEQIDMCTSYSYEPEPPKRRTGAEWLASETAESNRSITYHSEEMGKEEQRMNERNQWISALRESVPQPKSKAAEQSNV